MTDNNSDTPQLHVHDPQRPTSIDLTLELERQLEAESLPNSPNPPRPQSLDGNVLASIVTQLRLSLADVTKERDGFAGKLSEVQTREQGMRETLDHVAEKCLSMEGDLEAAAIQRKEDEETIAMLRTKVEESRRALMRLQTERRMSQASNLTLDLSRPPPSHASLSGPPSSKRASFVPLTGSSAGRNMHAHRRISSVSDTGFTLNGSLGEPSTWPPPSPRSPLIPEDPDPTPVAPTDRSSKRMSLLFGRGGALLPEAAASDVEVQALQKQIRSLQQQLDDSKRDLVESQEAHEASELCVRALRTFISEHNVGVPLSMGDPARNATKAPSTSHAKQPSTASRWGFRLWTTTDPETNKASTPSSTPIATFPPTELSAHSSSPAVPRKFGGLFSSRTTSVSSTGSIRPTDEPVHHEPMFNGSDTSSLEDSTGPISPTTESRGPLATTLAMEKPGSAVEATVHITQLELAHEAPELPAVV